MKSRKNYLAYGSNLHPLRLTGRVPNACLVGTTELRGYRLGFHKRSVDGSAKCTLHYAADSDDIAYAAVYSITENEVAVLDAIEGVGEGYDRQHLSVTLGDERLDVFTYIASETYVVFDLEPYHWYKGLVLAGAQYHDFPPHYIQAIGAVSSRQDTDTRRRIENENLLAGIEE
jgi:gamma-glutamylcyclotransferase (GGCT)/AIG2-like uncharacterized protein YtfP